MQFVMVKHPDLNTRSVEQSARNPGVALLILKPNAGRIYVGCDELE